MLVPFVAGLLGAALGPLVHHLAVASGADLPFRPADARCRRCTARLDGLTASCRTCGLSNGRIWVVTATTAALLAAVGWRVGAAWVLPAYLLWAAMTVVLLVTDLDHKRIPNRITYPGTPVAVLLLAVGALADGTIARLPRSLAGGLIYSAVLLVVFVAARGGFGFGDVKLAVPLGVFATYPGWGQLVVAGFTTAALGGLVAIWALVAGGATAKTEIPYGPPMIVGAWIAVVGGEQLVGIVL